jgi:phosphoribosyl 1,2-cyclic phosphate phosphodiesterase
MKITVMGSGTSHGVPMIGCDCDVCRSDNPKNRRMRPSITVTTDSGVILVDTTPELRLQALATDLGRVDAVLITHTHADHIMGLDDLRRFNDMADREIPVYGTAENLNDIRRIYGYIFTQTQAGGGKPRLTLHELQPEFELCGLHIRSFPVMHGRITVQAYRFDDPATGHSAAYVTDVNFIPPDSMDQLHNLDLLLLDAVRYEPHVTHFGLYQALDVIAELQPKQALLTHLSHRFDHATVTAETPPHVAPAYDGQIIVL